MDLLSKRYASPLFLLDGYISTGRLCDFIVEIFKLKKEDDRWEYFLNKIFEQSFDDFCEDLDKTEMHQNMSKTEMETTLKMSEDILNNFSPERE